MKRTIVKRTVEVAVAAVCLPLTLPVVAAAQEDLSYSYLEGDYVSLDIDGVDEQGDLIDDIDDGNGFGVRSSLALSSRFFVFADYSETNSDVTFDSGTGILPQDTDINRLNAGAGFRVPLMDRTDLVFRGAYTDIDFGDFDFGGSDDPDLADLNDDSSDGWFADAGLRSQVFESFEGMAAVRYTDIEDRDQFSLVGEGLFELNQTLGLSIGFEAGDEITTYHAGVRLSFGGPVYD